MAQRFRRNLDDIPTRNYEDLHDMCRQRVILYLHASHVVIRPCTFCRQILMAHEQDSWCCERNRRKHFLWPAVTPNLQTIMNKPSWSANARMVNSLFTNVVIYSGDKGAGFTYHVGSGPPSLRISGQMHARWMRTTETCWFVHDAQYHDTFLKLSHEFKGVVRQIRVILLQSMNPFANIAHLPSPGNKSQVNDGYIALGMESDARHLFCVYVGPGSLPPARTLYHIGSRCIVDEEDPLWELMSYIMFHPVPNVSHTWRPGYKSIDGTRMTLLGYLRSVMLNEPNYWKSGKLAHQHVLDTWCRNEQRLIKVWRSPAVQDRIRAFVARIYGSATLSNSKIFLPASVPGSFRYQQRFFHDTLYIASRLGNPHLFITMTANTHWPEVRAALRPGETANDRLDVIARAFVGRRQKLIQLLDTKDFLFPGHEGILYIVYVTEWQLCGLPHLHMAVALRASVPLDTFQDQLRIMDHVISARYPAERGLAYDMVESFMTHNDPCKVCLRDNPHTHRKQCRFRFPKAVNEFSRIDAKGFPIYRRTQADVRIIPHCVKLLLELGCHTNVEWTYQCGCIAYLYKYFTKGVDSSGVKISDYQDEIAAFKRARLMTAGEACYRTLGFRVNYRDPSVILCKFCLPSRKTPGQGVVDEPARQYMAGEPDALHEELHDMANEDGNLHDDDHDYDDNDDPSEGNGGQQTTLVTYGQLPAYFARPLEIVEDLTFCQFFEQYYCILAKNVSKYSAHTLATCMPDVFGNYWKKRDDNNRMFARMHWMSHASGEAYYLRKLLLVFSARGYDDLYRGFSTFRESAQDAGLVAYDNENQYTLLDAVAEAHSSAACRRLFIMLLYHSGRPESMINAWENDIIRNRMCFDFLPAESRGENWDNATHVSEQLCLCDFVLIAFNMGQELDLTVYDLPLPPHTDDDLRDLISNVGIGQCITLDKYLAHASIVVTLPPNPIDQIHVRVIRDHMNEVRRYMTNTPPLPTCDMTLQVAMLNPEQKLIFDTLSSMISNRRGGMYHVDAPAGCGKTFVCRVLLDFARHLDLVALPCATTGIASLQYRNGRTVHNLFDILPKEDKQLISGPALDSRLLEKIEKGYTSARIELLRHATLITWDEFPMSSKMLAEAVDRLLRVIMNKPHVPFGGKLILTLGDWRQISAVNPDNAMRNSTSSVDSYATSAFNYSFLSSPLWNFFNANTFRLHENIRARTDPTFHEKLMDIGNGTSGLIVEIPSLEIQVMYNLEDAIQWVFEDIEFDEDTLEPTFDPTHCGRRAIIAPFNREVDEINRFAQSKYALHYPQTKFVRLLSIDTAEHDDDLTPPVRSFLPDDPLMQLINAQLHHLDNVEADPRNQRRTRDDEPADPADPFGDIHLGTEQPFFDLSVIPEQKLESGTFCEEVLHTLKSPGVPPHALDVWVGASCMLLRNLDPENALQNGSRMTVRNVNSSRRLMSVCHAHEAHHADAPIFLIPRIVFPFKVGGFDVQYTRKQFPIRLAYGITIHKSQASTLDRVVIDLRTGIFDHGQLYVALSRVRNRKDVRILINRDQTQLLNIVHRILLSLPD